MKRYILMLLTSLLLSASLFAFELATAADERQAAAIEVLVESTCESESSPQPVWDDLYTKISLEFPELCKKISSSRSNFIFFEIKKDIFRPPWIV